jgi:CO dehydrogenase/acetyl-CoA synthase gamma subunit (corrinoid Fe-S protein)
MHVLLVTNNLVRLNFLTSLLRDAGIDSLVLDHQVSTMEGSIGAIPRRLAVATEDADLAQKILAEAGEA